MENSPQIEQLSQLQFTVVDHEFLPSVSSYEELPLALYQVFAKSQLCLMMLAGLKPAEVSPLVGRVSPGQSRRLTKVSAVVVGVSVVCVCLVTRAALHGPTLPTSLLSHDPRLGGEDGLGILGARQRIQIPANAQQLAVDSMADVRERANG